MSSADRARIAQEIADDILGYGPIEPLLRDPDLTEVMVNASDDIYIERSGKLRQGRRAASPTRPTCAARSTRSSARSAVASTSPARWCDARLPDGSRVNAIIPPLALDGSMLTIRKFSADPYTVEDLIALRHALAAPSRDLLDDCVRGRLNILVSGGTGAGKTTTLNVLSSFIPDDERIVTIEDAAELRLAPGPRAPARVPPAQHRGQGRGHDPRPGQELAAYAPRPHRRR